MCVFERRSLSPEEKPESSGDFAMCAAVRSSALFSRSTLIFVLSFSGGLPLAQAEEVASEVVSGEESVLAPVIVTSDLDKQNTPLVKAPGSLLKRDREQIREKTASDLSDVLSFEPNVDFTGGPRGATSS